MRWIDFLERELARVPPPETAEDTAGASYLAGCAAAMRDIIDALGAHEDVASAVAWVARRRRVAPALHVARAWSAGHVDTLRLFASRARAEDQRPVDWKMIR